MSRIVLLTRAYLNSRSANATCAFNVFEALRCYGHEVIIISYENTEANPSEGRVQIISKKEARAESKGIGSRALGFLKLINGKVDQLIDRSIVDLYIEKMLQLEADSPFDAIVSFMFPLETVQAAAEFKKKNPRIRTVVYELDSTGDGIVQSHFPFFYNRTVKSWLNGVYLFFDSIIIMKSHKEYWKNQFGKRFGRKMRIADIPVLKEHFGLDNNVDQKVMMVYSGVLDKKYRSPSFLLEVLEYLKKDNDFEFVFFSKGDCEKEIAKKAILVSEIKQKGYVKESELESYLLRATILVSIGNTKSKSVPSKIIHYMSFGKPIIHFSSQRKDVCKEYFSNYPLALVVDQSRGVRKTSSIISEFIAEVKGRTVSFNEVRKSLYMSDPMYSAEIILGDLL